MSRIAVELKNRANDTLKGFSWVIGDQEKLVGNVIIITGMQESASRYDGFAKFLNSHDYNVYCIDHYGQGENVDEDLKNLGVWPLSGFRKFVNTIDDLVIKLRLSCRPTYIIGHSMGSFMLQDYIQRHTEHISKVVIVGSGRKPFAPILGYQVARLLVRKPRRKTIIDEKGKKIKVEDPNHEKQSWFKRNKLLHTLALGNSNALVMKQYKEALKNKGEGEEVNVPDKNAWLTRDEEIVAKYNEDPKCGGVFSGGFYREFFKGLRRLHQRKFVKKVRPSLSIFIIGGQEDPVGNYGKELVKLQKAYLKTGVKDVELKLYPKMRHEILNEIGKEEVYQDILNFIKE